MPRSKTERTLSKLSRAAFFAIAGPPLLAAYASGAGDVNAFRLFFPQVVRGTAGSYVETHILVTNPGPQSVEIALESEQFEFEDGDASFALGPHESRAIVLSGEPFRTGAVALGASAPVGGSALILSREGPEAEETLSEVTVIGTPPMTKAVVPVLVNSSLAENTGIAVNYLLTATFFELRFTLYDSDGNEVATRRETPPFDPNQGPFEASSDQAAFFVTELFPDLPAGFTFGSLVVDRPTEVPIPDGFALVALYTRGTRFWAAEVASLDVIGSYVVWLHSGENLEDVARDLAEMYGFEIGVTPQDHSFFSIAATREVARAVSRDARVARVTGSVPVSLSAEDQGLDVEAR